MKKSTIILIVAVLVYFSAHSFIAYIVNPENTDALVKKISLGEKFHHLKINIFYSAFIDINVIEKPDTSEINYTGNMVNSENFYTIENDTLSINIDTLHKNKIHSVDINTSTIESININSTDRNYFNFTLLNGNKKIIIKGEPNITINNSRADTINVQCSDSLRIYFTQSSFSFINITSAAKNIKRLEFNNCKFDGIKVNK